MPTAEKNAIIEQYTEKFKDAKSVYVAEYEGVDVETVTAIRKKFRESDIEYKVLKNRLARIALNNNDVSEMDTHLTGANAYIIGYDDPVAPAKIIEEFNKKHEVLRLKAVLFEGKVLDTEAAKDISKLPTRDALIGQFVGMIQSPMTKFAATLSAPMQKMVGVLNALKDKKE